MVEFDTYYALEKIRKRPGMYIGGNTLEHLRAYLSGYWMAMEDLEVKDKAIPSFDGFYDWAAKECKGRNAPYGWGNMILAVSLGDNPETVLWEDYSKKATDKQHLESIKLFYRLLDQYREEYKNA